MKPVPNPNPSRQVAPNRTLKPLQYHTPPRLAPHQQTTPHLEALTLPYPTSQRRTLPDPAVPRIPCHTIRCHN